MSDELKEKEVLKEHKKSIGIIGRLIIIITVVVLVIAGITLALMYETGDIYTILKDPSELDKTTWHKWNKKKTERAKYVGETNYDGSADVPYQLYDIPFYDEGEYEGGPAENMYNSNKNLLESLDDKTIKEYMRNAKDVVDTLFGQSYLTVSADSDAYIDKVLSFYQDPVYYTGAEGEDEEGTDMEEMASKIAEFYVDNEITCMYEWKTDKSLFFRTYYSYTTRGVCYLTITSNLHENGEPCIPAKELWGFDVNYGEEIPLVMDIGFSAWGNSDGLGVFKMTKLSDIEDWTKENN